MSHSLCGGTGPGRFSRSRTGSRCSKLLLQLPERRTVSVAAAEESGVDTAVVAVLSEPDSIFTLPELDRLSMMKKMFSLSCKVYKP